METNKKAENDKTANGAPVSDAITAAQSDHQNATAAEPDWGIYTFFFNDDHCDYEMSKSLEEG